MSERIDAVVIGAGVVGLATARALALQGRETMVLERRNAVGTETSSRNSEVIHAGLYYRPGGLRARLCAPGREMLYAYCAERGVGCERLGKLVVATHPDEVPRLAALKGVAEANGVSDLSFVSGDEAGRLEPGLACTAALLSPSTGVIDAHGLMLALLGDFENAGGAVALSSPVVGGRTTGEGVDLDVGGDDPSTLAAGLVVNCAGLWADAVARSISGLDLTMIPAQRPAKGRYFTVSGKAPFSRLVYPLHTPDSQGIHYTRDLGGQARLGPDISWSAPLGDYSVEEAERETFFRAALKFWPDLRIEQLNPGYAGQRPKTTGPGEEGDFIVHGPDRHGTPGYIGLYGIESPGLTSCLAIANLVAALAEQTRRC